MLRYIFVRRNTRNCSRSCSTSAATCFITVCIRLAERIYNTLFATADEAAANFADCETVRSPSRNRSAPTHMAGGWSHRVCGVVDLFPLRSPDTIQAGAQRYCARCCYCRKAPHARFPAAIRSAARTRHTPSRTTRPRAVRHDPSRRDRPGCRRFKQVVPHRLRCCDERDTHPSRRTSTDRPVFTHRPRWGPVVLFLRSNRTWPRWRARRYDRGRANRPNLPYYRRNASCGRTLAGECRQDHGFSPLVGFFCRDECSL